MTLSECPLSSTLLIKDLPYEIFSSRRGLDFDESQRSKLQNKNRQILGCTAPQAVSNDLSPYLVWWNLQQTKYVMIRCERKAATSTRYLDESTPTNGNLPCQCRRLITCIYNLNSYLISLIFMLILCNFDACYLNL